MAHNNGEQSFPRKRGVLLLTCCSCAASQTAQDRRNSRIDCRQALPGATPLAHR